MKKSYHSSAEPTAEASITRPSDDFSRTTPEPVISAVMVSLPDGFVLVAVIGRMLASRREHGKPSGAGRRLQATPETTDRAALRMRPRELPKSPARQRVSTPS